MKEEYKKLILAFASLSELSARKNIATDNKTLTDNLFQVSRNGILTIIQRLK
jgi:hypothetical protein